MEQLQGTWKYVSLEENGKAVTDDQIKECTLTFNGDKWTMKQGDKVVQAGTYKLEPSKSPKTYDAPVTEGEGKGTTLLGIYELSGDTLKFCHDNSGKERPKEFKSKADSNVVVATVKKAKP